VRRGAYFDFVRAVTVVDELPNDLVVLHGDPREARARGPTRGSLKTPDPNLGP